MATSVFAQEPSSKMQTQTTLMPKAAKLVPFLRKVQQLCETCPKHVARWSADGKQFDVLDPKAFDELLKVHFEGASPATFHRQLFFYGWVKLNHTNGGGDEKTKGTWSFRHPSFLRDEPSRIYEIKRYARASDREEQEDGSRVDILERRVSALQSLVDDLSRKLAAVQLTLESTPIPVPAATQTPPSPLVSVSTEKSGRKRMKDIDEEFLSGDFRLSEDDFMNLFDDVPMIPEVEHSLSITPKSSPAQAKEVVTRMQPMLPPTAQLSSARSRSSANKPTSTEVNQEAEQAKGLLSSFMSTPQFQAAISSTIQDKPAPKVESLPHLSVC